MEPQAEIQEGNEIALQMPNSADVNEQAFGCPAPVDHAAGNVNNQPDDHEKGQDLEALIPTVRSGVESLQARKDEINQRIEGMISVGTQFLVSVKEDFIARLRGFQTEVYNLVEMEVAGLLKISEQTVEAQARLDKARQLVQSLGMGALCQDLV